MLEVNVNHVGSLDGREHLIELYLITTQGRVAMAAIPSLKFSASPQNNFASSAAG
jgi:hypothetical protein